MDCSPSGTSVHGILQVRNMAWLAYLFSRDLPDPGMNPALQVDSLPAELPGVELVIASGQLNALL